MKDHLGNTRVTFGGHSNGQPEIMQKTEYYPFGLVMNQQNYFADGVLSNKFLYNGKELQDDELAGSKLDWYDYGWRFYDPALGRWHVPDPLAEKYYDHSVYCYVGNNPISRIDPDGREWDTDEDKEKAKKLQEQSNKQIENLRNSNSTLDQKISKAKEKGNDKKVTRLGNRKANNNHQIRELNKGIDEVQSLGDTKDYTFTFTPVSSDDHNVTLLKGGEKPLISLEYSSNEIALHESRHAYQYITDGKNYGRMVFNKDKKLSYTSQNATIWYETKAYQLQYSLLNSSLPVSVSGFFGINKDWLKSISGNPYQIK